MATELPFFIKEDSRIPKKILLIDDIYTTGSTVNRVKSMLENAGAEEVRTFPRKMRKKIAKKIMKAL